MPALAGNCLIFFGSLPAMHTAALMARAEKAPGVTKAASAPVNAAILLPAFSSSFHSHAWELFASTIASLTSLGRMAPPNRVYVSKQLIIRLTPSSSYLLMGSTVPPP